MGDALKMARRPFPLVRAEIAAARKMLGLATDDIARRILERERQQCEHWHNDRYEVILGPPRWSVLGQKMRQMLVRRSNWAKIPDHWQTLQRIKNEVLGDSWWGYEVYPGQDMVIDTHNTYHLWCVRYPLFPTYTQAEADALR